MVADGEVLVGTIATLSIALQVPEAELRAALRELLEAQRIAVHTGAAGQIVIREERRMRQSLPRLVDRRRPAPDVWIL
jgi:hypothetical protein